MTDTSTSLTNPNCRTLAELKLLILQPSSIFHEYLREIPEAVDRLEDTSGCFVPFFVPEGKNVIPPRKLHPWYGREPNLNIKRAQI
ncbi:hypothetical protein RSAG8_13445, partial [Rhizoctonia solani AG-8 WAC10335]